MISIAIGHASRVSRASRAASDSPSSTSITRNIEPSSSVPKSLTAMMFGWSSWPDANAST